MVSLQCGSIKIKYNISLIKLCKYDTKVEGFNSKNMDNAVKIQIIGYILLYEINARNKVYDRMHTATFDINSYHPCTWSFYDKLFSPQRLHLWNIRAY